MNELKPSLRLALLSIALLCFTGCGKKSPELLSVSGKPIEFWLDALREGGTDSPQRIKAIKALGNVGPAHPAAIPALIKALDSPEIAVRVEAVLALLKNGPHAKEALPVLQRMAQSDKEANVRSYAEKAIAKISGS